MLGPDIEFYTGHMGGDCSSAYHIRLLRDFTVKEFVERVLNIKDEWGEIRICAPDGRIIAELDFNRGDIKREDPEFEKFYDRTIESVSGHGGWSASKFLIWVKEE